MKSNVFAEVLTPAAAGLVSSLTPREREVLVWAMQGKTNWETSVILSLSEATVKFHVRNAMSKLNATSRAQAVAVALRQGLIAADIREAP